MEKRRLGVPERPLRAVIVGSGPAGFYAAEALLQCGLAVRVDMLDRLPTPYGLVRGGVAPDHHKIKRVTAIYERIASDPRFQFFGHIRLGTHVQVQDLRRHYDCVIYAVGSEGDRKMGIPGEDLPGSWAATEFVGWYNGHPDYRERSFDLSCEAAAVVGIGNVALDVARILAKDPEALAGTDIADYALDALRRSRIRQVYLLGRRGPAQAAFSPPEIEEMGALPGADLVVRPEEAELDPVSRAAYEKESDVGQKKIVEYLLARSKKGEGSRPRKVRLRLRVSPVEIVGEDGRVAAVRIEQNELYEDERGRIHPRGTGRFETLPVGLILRSVGYHGVPVPGVPFHRKAGIIPNDGGRVLDEEGKRLPCQYVVGWAKRGPSGLVGTNRACSVATVKALLEDVRRKEAPCDPDRTPEAAEKMLRSRQPELVSFQDWKVLDRLEIERGKAKGKVREKFSRVTEMLAALKRAKNASD
ncbi:MAG: FAD-dependent oxidoreductase [Elusimicrobiota bacterium]